MFAEEIKKFSQRDYARGLPKIASSFGFQKNSVLRSWIKATSKKIDELQKRILLNMDIRAVFFDGKRFRKHDAIIALGVGADGKKHVLGIYQANTENSGSCIELFNDLQARGLPESGLLFIVDGGSGLNKPLNAKYRCDDQIERRAIRIRCFVHSVP